MGLCHRTLSRSQLNTIAKLKEAGIIVNNLVVLPNTSSTSPGQQRHPHHSGEPGAQSLLPGTGWRARFEKYFGDLVIKIVEHFLPLFVTTCSAAPHRLSFSDFHPEKVLGYLPHELDYTHLRMLWRRWKKKADLRFCGHSFTPLGPLWLDRLTSGLLRLRGDYLPDVRLIDYLVALQSVEQSPALNGMLGNQEQLKQDLTEMGVFDSRMAIYLPYRMRALAAYGFSGFEGRHYSLFPDLSETFARSVDLQTLVTQMAYRWVIEGTVTHADIPDDPCTESERRQIFFASAIGVPTVFLRADTKNKLLAPDHRAGRAATAQPPLQGLFAGRSGGLSTGLSGSAAGGMLDGDRRQRGGNGDLCQPRGHAQRNEAHGSSATDRRHSRQARPGFGSDADQGRRLQPGGGNLLPHRSLPPPSDQRPGYPDRRRQET